MKRDRMNVLAALLAAVIVLTGFGVLHIYRASHQSEQKTLKIGFVLDGDGSTAYTANFMLAVNQFTAYFGDRIEVTERFQVPYEAAERVIGELTGEGCGMIVTNSYGYSEAAKRAAERNPSVQFCQATGDNANTAPVLPNYHTFMGRIAEGRYACGVVAGRKLTAMIESGEITAEEAVIGYVAAFPVAEVISGYTAFLLGVRSQCPSAVMRVRYTNAWSDYADEKRAAEKLILEGCRVIAQHSDTIGPALVCENTAVGHRVYHVGYNRDMTEVAPTVSLISARTDWSPYLIAAVDAILSEGRIETYAGGSVHGNDAGGGFAEGWVSLYQLNEAAVPSDCEALLRETVQALKDGKVQIFSGAYTGADPNDPSDVYDLRTPYPENAVSSAPTFHYVLRDVITVDE